MRCDPDLIDMVDDFGRFPSATERDAWYARRYGPVERDAGAGLRLNRDLKGQPVDNDISIEHRPDDSRFPFAVRVGNSSYFFASLAEAERQAAAARAQRQDDADPNRCQNCGARNLSLVEWSDDPEDDGTWRTCRACRRELRALAAHDAADNGGGW